MAAVRRRIRVAGLLDYVGGPYQTDVRLSLERVARERDVDLILAYGQRLEAPSAFERTHNRVYDMLGRERIDGLVVVSSVIANYCDDARLHEFFRKYAPLPTCSIGRPVDGAPSVVVDNMRAMHQIVSHLIDVHQRRRIAYIGGPAESKEARDRLAGYRAALSAGGIDYEPQLVIEGQFTRSSGAEVAERLLGGNAGFDALATANDEMALGALGVLKGRNVAVPDDVAVCGFDDVIDAGYSSPSLSTVRQPLRMLASRGLEFVLEQIAGRTVPPISLVQVELMRRESCGCGQPLGQAALHGANGDCSLRQVLADSVIAPSALQDWPSELLDALDGSPGGREARFMRALGNVLVAAEAQGVKLEEFHRAILLLRSFYGRDGQRSVELEDLWQRSRTAIAAAALRVQGTLRLNLETATQRIGWSGERISTSLSRPVLSAALAEELPRIGVSDVAVSLYRDSTCANLESIVAVKDGLVVPDVGAPMPPRELAPDAFFDSPRQRTLIAFPVRFQSESLGVVLLESGRDTPTYPYLATVVGAAVKASELHRSVIDQIAARQRLEQEHLVEQARVAARIQTALTPRDVSLQGLEIATEMRAAAQVGGDYFDLLPTPAGGWLAIGDVTGHGLTAGLMSLMLQSQVAALVNALPEASPASLVCSMNRALRDNIRNRLERDDHATLVLLRYERSGRVVFAGAHDPILVCRAESRCVECIETHGVWIGALGDVSSRTHDAEFTLREGDVLVLHTDGVTEARNAHHEQFGLERLCKSIITHAQKPARDIVSGVLHDVGAWTTSIDDDMSLVVARYSVSTG